LLCQCSHLFTAYQELFHQMQSDHGMEMTTHPCPVRNEWRCTTSPLPMSTWHATGQRFFRRRGAACYYQQTQFTAQCGPVSSVSIATGYGMDGPGIENRWQRHLTHLSRPALGPIQPPVRGVSGLSRGLSAAGA